MDGGTEPAITGKDALKSLRILLAVYESSRTGRPIRFADVEPPVRVHVPADVEVSAEIRVPAEAAG